jgi:hypothetical protein
MYENISTKNKFYSNEKIEKKIQCLLKYKNNKFRFFNKFILDE